MSHLETPPKALVLSNGQLEDIRTSLVQRRLRIAELIDLAKADASSALVEHLTRDQSRISDLLLVVARA